jgi:hypothetical protein
MKLLGENLPPTRQQEYFLETVTFMAYVTCFDGHETCTAVCIARSEGQFLNISQTDLGWSFLGPVVSAIRL